MKTPVCAIALTGLSSLAMAAPSLDYQASLDGVTWSDSITATTNSTVKIRALVRWTDVTAYGFAGMNFKITASNWDAGDSSSIPNGPDLGPSTAFRAAPFNRPGYTVGTAMTGNTRRWYQVGSTGSEGYLSLVQMAPASSTAFSTDNPAIVMAFDYTIGAVADRSVEFSGPISKNQLNLPGDEFAFYSSASNTSTAFRVSGFVDSAVINIIVPAPAASSALLLALGVTARRRRPV